MLGHVVDEHPDSGWKMFAAEIAEIVTAIVGRVLGETTDQPSVAKQIANLVSGQLRDAEPVENRL